MTILTIIFSVVAIALLVFAAVLQMITIKREQDTMTELYEENQRLTAAIERDKEHYKNSTALREDIMNLQQERIAQLERINNLLMNEISSEKNKEATH